MNQRDQLIEEIRALLKHFPLVGMSGIRTVRFIDEDTFMAGVELILKELDI